MAPAIELLVLLVEPRRRPKAAWPRPGERLVVAEARWAAAREGTAASRPAWSWLLQGAAISPARCAAIRCTGKAMISTCRCWPAISSPTSDGTGFVHIAPGHGEDDFELGQRHGIEVPRDRRRRRHLLSRRCRSSPASTSTSPTARTGDANSAVIAAIEAGALLGARQARPFLPAFLALQGAADLPHHAAMVHRDGDERAARRRRSTAIDATRWVPPQGENRIRAMIETPARLVHLAPARLGRADRGLRRQEDRRAAARPGRGRPHRRGLRARGRRCLVHRATRATSSGRPRIPPITSRSRTSSMSGSIPARPTPSCWRQRPDLQWPASLYLEGSDQHRGWFHSSLLGILRHARPRALRGGADARLRARRAGAQDVEVAGQRHLRRRKWWRKSGADILRLWVVGVGLHRGSAHRPRDPEVPGRRSIAGCATRCAICWARSTDFSEKRANRARARCRSSSAGCCIACAELDARGARVGRGLRFPHHVHRAAQFLRRRSLRLLFRRAQGFALLRSGRRLRRRAARTVLDRVFDCLAAGSRRCCASPPRKPGSAAMATPTASSVHLAALSRSAGRLARRRAGREMGDESASCAASSPARSNWSARRSASARAFRPRSRFPRPLQRKDDFRDVDLAEIFITSGAAFSDGEPFESRFSFG